MTAYKTTMPLEVFIVKIVLVRFKMGTKTIKNRSSHHLCYILAKQNKRLLMFCLCLETLSEAEFKNNRLEASSVVKSTYSLLLQRTQL